MDGASVGGAPVLNTWKGGSPKISLHSVMLAGRRQELVEKEPNVLILNSIFWVSYQPLLHLLLLMLSCPLLSPSLPSPHLVKLWYVEDGGCDSGTQTAGGNEDGVSGYGGEGQSGRWQNRCRDEVKTGSCEREAEVDRSRLIGGFCCGDTLGGKVLS